MKEERLKKNSEGAPEILSWVNRSRKIEQIKNVEKKKALQLSKIFEEQVSIFYLYFLALCLKNMFISRDAKNQYDGMQFCRTTLFKEKVKMRRQGSTVAVCYYFTSTSCFLIITNIMCMYACRTA